jgi:DNA-directed RNA polymerase subunit RPC12/RpoP
MDADDNFTIIIEPDSNGFIDQCCPKCKQLFKVNLDDYKSKIRLSGEEYCTYCGEKDSPNHFYTDYQQEKIEEQVDSFVNVFALAKINNLLSSFADSCPKDGPIRITYKPQQIPNFEHFPIESTKPFEQEVACPYCGTKFSAFGNVYFCPSCGKQIPTKIFKEEMLFIKDSVGKIDSLFSSTNNPELITNLKNFFIEESLGNVVGDFQYIAFAKYTEIKGPEDPLLSPLFFQNLDKGDKCFKDLTGEGFSDLISKADYDFLKIEFQKRHCLTHRVGIVDDKYLERSSDSTATEGTRLQIQQEEVLKLCNCILQLADKVLSLTPKKSSLK